MKSSRHYKQILLFLLTVFLPSSVLIIFTVRMINQERELAQRRSLEERQRVAHEIGNQLLIRLEKIKLQEANAVENKQNLPEINCFINPEVEIICLIEEGKLLLPWERNQKIEEAQDLLIIPEFIKKIQQAEKEEFVNKNYLRASQLYTQIFQTFEDTLQKNYARLLLARTQLKLSQKEKASAQYQEILLLPYTITDEYGIPLSMYAADRLLEIKKNGSDILIHIQNELNNVPRLSPSAAFFILNIIEKLPIDDSDSPIRNKASFYRDVIQTHIGKLEQAMALKKNYPGLDLTLNQGNQLEKKNPLWILYGEDPWLISLTGSGFNRFTFLIAVSAEKIISSLESDHNFRETFPVDIHFLSDKEPDGFSLGSNYLGVKIDYGGNQVVMFPPLWSFRPAFYLLALILILGITLFGAYLLWRDIRREVQIAEMRSQFVSSVSHELKTPLTAIRMFAETLRMGRLKDLKMQTEFLDTIVNESQRLTRLLNNVLDFSRIEQGKRMYRPEPASLYGIIESVIQTMEYPLSQQGFNLQVQTEENLPKVLADRDALEQALLNLLHNAMKYSGESRDIHLKLLRKDSYALIQVIDWGIGIAPKEQKRIFEKFYRISSSDNQRIVGTGLGLALVSHIIKAHGGHLELESAPGKGSTFSIYLPLEDQT
jgi:hypothetical protein